MKSVRVIACQGPSQLITALSVMHQRHGEGPWGRVVVVVFGLYANSHQSRQLIRQIRLLASVWPGVEVRVLPERWIASLSSASPRLASLALSLALKISGANAVTELYLAREWLGGNQLLMRLFSRATKVCYGDGIGFYFSQGFATPEGTTAERYFVGPDRASGESVAFDHHYLLLPNLFGEVPSGESHRLERESVLSILIGLSSLVDGKLPSGRALLLTSNVSESYRMTEADEVEAYCEFLETNSLKLPVVIKPHPRDSRQKLARLKKRLNAEVCEEQLPLEVMLAGMTAEEVGSLEFFSFGAASLSVPVLFGASTRFGFGEEIVRRRYLADHVGVRLRYEQGVRRYLGLAE